MVVAEDVCAPPETAAAVDVHPVGKTVLCAAVCVVRLPDMDLVDAVRVEVEVAFPYVPGLLAFREGPAALAAFD